MSDEEKIQRLEQAIQRIRAAERELKLAKVELQSALTIALQDGEPVLVRK